ncbi:MAG: precorrin-8X methylmutase [Rhodospirillales bacterium]
MFDYVRDPASITERSFEIVKAEADLQGLAPLEAEVAIRLVHACGMPDIVPDLRFNGDPVAAGRRALAQGRPVLADTEMVAAGIQHNRLSQGNQVVCTLNDDRVPKLARLLVNTRSAAAVELWRLHLEGAVAVVGNAPTALYRLLELIEEGTGPPAVILGFPVGFVGAAESKDALVDHAGDIPFITLLGRRGGSALAAACVNALAAAGPAPEKSP